MTLTTGKHIFLKNTLFVTWTPDEKLNSDCTAVRYKKYEGKNCSELKKNGRAHEYRSWKNEYDVLYFLTWLWTDPYVQLTPGQKLGHQRSLTYFQSATTTG